MAVQLVSAAIPVAALPPLHAGTLLSSLQLDPVPVCLLIATAAAYLTGVIRLHRRGTHWPWARTICFIGLGLGSIAAVTLTGVAAYDDTLLSVHMVQHMVLGMVAPIFLALGAPTTLALRALPLGPRRRLTSLLHSRPIRVLTFPVVSYALFVATPFALYFTGLYRLMLTNSALHQLLHVHFLVVGCLFFWPLIGLDPLPGKWPYPARALLMLLSTPFHTILGLTVMQSRSLIGGDYYPSLHLGWANPAADQQVAGGILWAGGELVSVVMLAVLVVQWMRQSDREAARLDRQLDRSRVTRQIGTGQASATEEPEPLWERPWWELERPGVGQRIEAEAAGYDQGASTGGSKPI